MITAEQAAETSERTKKMLMDGYLKAIEERVGEWITKAASSGMNRIEFSSRDFGVPCHLWKIFTYALRTSLDPGGFKLDTNFPGREGDPMRYVVYWGQAEGD